MTKIEEYSYNDLISRNSLDGEFFSTILNITGARRFLTGEEEIFERYRQLFTIVSVFSKNIGKNILCNRYIFMSKDKDTATIVASVVVLIENEKSYCVQYYSDPTILSFDIDSILLLIYELNKEMYKSKICFKKGDS